MAAKSDSASLSAEAASFVERFRAARQEGQESPLEEFLPPDAAALALRAEVLVQLVMLELEARPLTPFARPGQKDVLDEYFARFPELLKQPRSLCRLAAHDYRRRRKAGLRPQQGRYLERFPSAQEQLRAILQSIDEQFGSKPDSTIGSRSNSPSAGPSAAPTNSNAAPPARRSNPKSRFPADSPSAVRLPQSDSAAGRSAPKRPPRRASRPSASPPPTAKPSETPPAQPPLPEIEVPEPESANTTPKRAKLGHYQIQRQVGRGGFATVFLAYDPRLDREVALKLPHRERMLNPVDRERFLREAKAAAKLQHRNICQVYEIAKADNRVFLVMQFVDGKTLSELLAERQVVDPQEAVQIIRKVALALDLAHRKGLLHRDLKPANVMIDPHGEPVVMDFGLARRTDATERQLTMVGQVLGTPDYMSPEQVRSKELGAASDIYSLGVLLYEMLCGRRPFSGSAMAIFHQIATDEPPPLRKQNPNIDRELEQVCAKAMAKKPNQRFRTMAEFAQALAAWLKRAKLRSEAAARLASPDQEAIRGLKAAHAAYYDHPLLTFRTILVRTTVVICSLVMMIAAASGQEIIAAAAAGMLVLTPLSYFWVCGRRDEAPLYSRLREYWGLLPWWKKVPYWLLIVLVIAGLGWTRQIDVWAACLPATVGLAYFYYFVVGRTVRSVRAEPVAQARQHVKKLRQQGFDQWTLRRLVAAQFRDWEEFFEDLFSYEAKLLVRHDFEREAGQAGRRFHSLRDPLIRYLDRRIGRMLHNRGEQGWDDLEEDERRLDSADAPPYQEAEPSTVVSVDGVGSQPPDTAQLNQLPDSGDGGAPHGSPSAGADPGRAAAASAPDSGVAGIPLVDSAAVSPPTGALDDSASSSASAVMISAKALEEQERELKRQQIRAMMAEARGGEYQRDLDEQRRWRERDRRSGEWLIGQTSRLIWGGLLTAICLAWLMQNGSARTIEGLRSLDFRWDKYSDPLQLPLLSIEVTTVLTGFHIGVAGLILMASASIHNISIAYFAFPAAALAVLGPLLDLPTGPYVDSPQLAAAAAGLAFFCLGIFVADRW